MKKAIGIFLIILLLLTACVPATSQDVPLYSRSLTSTPTSSIVSQAKSIPDENGYREQAVTEDGKRIFTNGYDYKVKNNDGTLICQYNSVQWVRRTRTGVIHAPYIAMKRSDDGIETYYLLDENFQTVGESYRFIYHYGYNYGQFDKPVFTDDEDYYVAAKNGNVYQITPAYDVTELKHAGPCGEYLLNGKYQLTRYWYDVNSCVSGLIDTDGNEVLECKYRWLNEVLNDRIKAVTGDPVDLDMSRDWLFDENLNLLTNQFNSVIFITSEFGYVGIGQSMGTTLADDLGGLAVKGSYFINKNGTIVSRVYQEIGNFLQQSDYYINYGICYDPTLDFICTLPDGTTQEIPFKDVMIPFEKD